MHRHAFARAVICSSVFISVRLDGQTEYAFPEIPPSVLPPGSLSRLTFRVRDREIRVSVEVRHSVPGIGMGVQFLNLGPEDLAAIEALVRAHG